MDGSCPSSDIVLRFLDIVEGEPGGVAVHCKAGLGRTGVLICCYMMKHHGFSAKEVLLPLRKSRRFCTVVIVTHGYAPITRTRVKSHYIVIIPAQVFVWESYMGVSNLSPLQFNVAHIQSICVQAIAYIRVCRPGSVIGPQQTFLHINEAELWKHGELYRQHQKVLPGRCGVCYVYSSPCGFGIMLGHNAPLCCFHTEHVVAQLWSSAD